MRWINHLKLKLDRNNPRLMESTTSRNPNGGPQVGQYLGLKIGLHTWPKKYNIFTANINQKSSCLLSTNLPISLKKKTAHGLIFLKNYL